MIRALTLAACLVALPASAGTFDANTFRPDEVLPGARDKIVRMVRPGNRAGCALWFAGYPKPIDHRSDGWRMCKLFAWGDRVTGGRDISGPVGRTFRCSVPAYRGGSFTCY